MGPEASIWLPSWLWYSYKIQWAFSFRCSPDLPCTNEGTYLHSPFKLPRDTDKEHFTLLTFALLNEMTRPSRITSRYFSPQHHWVFPSFCFHNNRSRDSGALSSVSEKLALKPLFLLLGNKRLIKLAKRHEAWFPSNCFCTPELMTCSCPSREPVLRWMDTEEDICLTGHLSASACAYLEAGAFITRSILTSKNAH